MNKKGFTLVELLVVIAIIAILASILFEPLLRARGMARRAVCASNLKQLYLAMMMYAQDYDGWGIGTMSWGTPNTFTHYGNWIDSYFGKGSPPNGDSMLFRCPDTDWTAFKGSAWNYRPGRRSYGNPGYQWCSYWIMFGYSFHSTTCTDDFYGWHMYQGSTPTSQHKAPCPNIKFCGKSVTDPRTNYTAYILPASEQICVSDTYSYTGFWYGYGLTTGVRNNHREFDGGNVLYMDGHLEWKARTQFKYYFQYYYGGILW